LPQAGKAPEDRRSPKPGGRTGSPAKRASVLDCAGPLALLDARVTDGFNRTMNIRADLLFLQVASINTERN